MREPRRSKRTPRRQLAVGDAGGGEEHVVAPDQVVDVQDLLQVVAGVEGGLALVVVAWPQPAVHGPVEALEGAGGDHRLGRAADPDQHVDPGALAGGHDGPGDVAVGDQLDPGPGLADLADQVLVAGPVEDADGQVADMGALGLGDQAEVQGQRGLEVDRVGRLRADHQLLHVDARPRVEHGAAVREGHHRDGVGHALGGQGRPVDRVDGDVDLGQAAVADLLAVVEHGGVVLLALADHHHPGHRDRAEHVAHGVHGRLVDRLLVAEAHLAGRGHGGRLRDPDELEGQVAVGGLAFVSSFHQHTSGSDSGRRWPRTHFSPQGGLASRAAPAYPCIGGPARSGVRGLRQSGPGAADPTR